MTETSPRQGRKKVVEPDLMVSRAESYSIEKQAESPRMDAKTMMFKFNNFSLNGLFLIPNTLEIIASAQVPRTINSRVINA